MPRCCITALVLLIVLAAGVHARADGKVFPAIDHRAAIPDQQAMIAWRDGTETLAIETRFEGTGTRFAWVVPLPAQPEISPATTGLFPTLRAVSSPRLVSGTGGLGVLVLLIVFLIAGLAAARGAATKAAFFLVWAFVFFAFFLAPSLGTPRGPRPGPGVAVLDRKIVGSFETTTIAGDSAEPLIAWLTSSGFAVPAAAKPVIADYASRGWVFAAAKLTRNEQGGLATPHPLVFKFPTPQPVYPLKLTGVENGPVTVELYVFADGTAAASGFRCERSFKPEYGPVRTDSYRGFSPEISHEAVRALAQDLPVMTRLRGTLSPLQMAQDATIHIGPFQPQRMLVYSKGSAAGFAIDWAAAVFFATSAVSLALAALRHGLSVRLRGRQFAIPALCAAIAWAVVWLPLPTVPVTSSRSGVREWVRLTDLGEELLGRMYDRDVDAQAVTRDWARRQIELILDERGRDDFAPIEEDSPGNYTLRQTDAGLEFHCYNDAGNEAVLRLNP